MLCSSSLAKTPRLTFWLLAGWSHVAHASRISSRTNVDESESHQSGRAAAFGSAAVSWVSVGNGVRHPAPTFIGLVEPRSGVGHEERFLPPRLSGRYRVPKAFFAVDDQCT
jgi:hypothetical protein